MTKKYDVCVVGATGAVGANIISHPGRTGFPG